MSDPVTNVEIEDVLSSIRRLVSDEARTPIRAERDVAFSSDVPPQAVELEEETEVEPEQEPPKQAAPALVLTPALRIEPSKEESSEESDQIEASDDQASTFDEPALILTQDISAPVSEDAEQSEAGIESNLAENHEEPREQDALQEPAQDIVQSDAIEDASEQPVEAGEEAVQDAVEPPRSIEDKIAALESLIGDTQSDFEPDGEEDGANAAQSGDALPWEDSSESRNKPAEIELPDPDDASQSATFDEDAIAFQRAHSEAVEDVQSELENNATETLLEGDDLGAVLDEEALRDMVSEIVRQELQGPLGERITRNVRKLVRREIYRALAANELD